jgi:methionyl-tRNA formyltransferase
MRIVFIGRPNFANHCFANWLASHHDVVAYFTADRQRYTSGHRVRWLRKRIERGGVLRAFDQSLYQVYFRLFDARKNEDLKRAAFANAFGADAFRLRADIPVYAYDDLNGAAALDTLRSLRADLAFAVCISQYLRKPYQEIPRFGTALYHEGLTPEYKGLHTAFWAHHEGDAHRIGYTLLQLDGGIDAGRPLAQGVGKVDPALARWWNYAGHKALIDGLPDVQRALAAMEAGHPVGVEPRPAAAKSWTYPGLSDELRRLWRTRRAAPAS